MEITNDECDDTVKTMRQKVKHLQHEQHSALAVEKSRGLIGLQDVNDSHFDIESNLHWDIYELKQEFIRLDISHQDEIKALNIKHFEEIDTERNKFIEMTKVVQAKFEKLYEQFRNDMYTEFTKAMKNVEGRKNKQIEDLLRTHAKCFQDMKNYYNDVTVNNLAVVAGMKDEMTEQHTHFNRLNMKLHALTTENNKLAEPYRLAMEEINGLRYQLDNCNLDREALPATIKKLQETDDDIDTYTWKHESLKLKYKVVSI